MLAALAIIGVLVASGLTDGDESASNTPSVVTQISTQEGERVTVTETVEPPPPPPPPTPPPSSQQPPPPPSSASGRELTDQATGLMRQGRFDQALPIAQQALAKLIGSGEEP